MSEEQAPYGDSRLNEVMKALGERPISFYPILARIGGSVNAGLFLSQLCYWSPRGKTGDGWVYKTKAEWSAETLLSSREIDTVRNIWQRMGIIEESQPGGTDRTIFYRVNYSALADAIHNHDGASSIMQNRTLDCPPAHVVHYAETTAETTTKTTARQGAKAQGRTYLPVDDAFIAEMVGKYAQSLGEDRARLAIDKALHWNQERPKGWSDARRGVDNWLHEEALRKAERGGGNGTASTARGPDAPARKPTGLEKYG